MEATIGSRTASRKMIAMCLQCIPLLVVLGCVDAGMRGGSFTIFDAVLCLSALAWGGGYLYTGNIAGFVLASLAGSGLALGSFVCFSYLFDFDFAQGTYPSTTTGYVGLFGEAVLVALAVWVSADDLWQRMSA